MPDLKQKTQDLQREGRRLLFHHMNVTFDALGADAGGVGDGDEVRRGGAHGPGVERSMR
jgi:hypothetical protein